MNVRSSGILLHPTCLPGVHGIGDLGPEAYRFANFLSAAGQSIWQMLPLNPTEPDYGGSPYHSYSAFAGNPMLISPYFLVQSGLLFRKEVIPSHPFSDECIDFREVAEHKTRLLTRAFERYLGRGNRSFEFERFCIRQADWLQDYSTYMALKEHFQMRAWTRWPQPLRDRKKDALETVRHKFGRQIKKYQFWQFLFSRQWQALKKYCNQHDIRIYGDLPIYLPLDSVDAWSNPQQYKLNRDKELLAVSGVPPDYFSETGQLWGHPVYDWERLKQTGYKWWVERFARNFELFDVVRIDHFRGLVAYWEVAASAQTAVDGQWVPVPTFDFFTKLHKRFGQLPVIAEDLGTITADVREQMQVFQLPGMRVLQFAFGDDFPGGSFLPHHHIRNCIVYTGTHDNNTMRGWFEEELNEQQKDNLWRYIGRRVPADMIHRAMIRMAMRSVANTVIIPLQDVLGLGAEARMNHPAGRDGNWKWRLLPGQLTQRQARWLLDITISYGRHTPEK
jgi:4-alpha-glucanotransferase